MKMFWLDFKDSIGEEPIGDVKIKVYKERPKNLNDTLSDSVKKFPKKIALVHGGVYLTYQQLQEQVNQVAANLYHHYGVRKGDRVAMLLMNGIPFVVGVYAALKIGAIAIPLNTKLKSQELEFMITDSEAKVIITNLDWWSNLEPILKTIEVEYIFVTEPNPPKGTHSFSELTTVAPNLEVQTDLNENDGAFIMYTSGTTGKPKGALITHFNMVHTAINYEKCYGLSASDSTIIAVPIFHITGLAAQLMTFIHLGGKIVLMPKFEALQLLELLEREKITHLIASPTVYVMTLQHPDLGKFDVSHFRVGGFGGAPMPSETLKALKEWIPSIELHNTYGLTETTSPAIIMPKEWQMQKISAVGVPTPVTEVRVVNPDNQEEVAVGEVGELIFKGPMVIRSYWNNEEANQKAFKKGWFLTGDLAVIDEDGFVTIMDRIKDMINRGGEKIYSVEVEDVLYSNLKILEAAIVGVPDSRYGEVVKACVVPKENETLSEEEVKEWVQERLAKYKVPFYVEIMDVLPRNPNGKVVKTQLRYVPEASKKLEEFK